MEIATSGNDRVMWTRSGRQTGVAPVVVAAAAATLAPAAAQGSIVPVVSWTTLDDDDSDDRPLLTPDRTSDHQARFGGNESLAPGISQTLVAEVGVRIAIPSESRSGASATVRIGGAAPAALSALA